MSKSKILEALALVGLYPGCEFRLAGRDTTYCIDKDYGIITKSDDIIRNEKLGTILSNPTLITKCCEISQKEKEILKALYTLGCRYVARDMNLTLCAYALLPYRNKIAWECDGDWISFIDLPCFREDNFQFIRWDDEKPFDIKLFLEGEGYEI